LWRGQQFSAAKTMNKRFAVSVIKSATKSKRLNDAGIDWFIKLIELISFNSDFFAFYEKKFRHQYAKTQG
jgi:hypothetical protein